MGVTSTTNDSKKREEFEFLFDCLDHIEELLVDFESSEYRIVRQIERTIIMPKIKGNK